MHDKNGEHDDDNCDNDDERKGEWEKNRLGALRLPPITTV